ncbi:LLM class F420-dependent oxidoreductase [Saccharothrix xinjiangensis]
MVRHSTTSVDVAELARGAAAIGLAGVAQPELETDPFVPLAVAALADDRLRLSTAVAITFARTPMAMARAARDLSELSGGRFVLGLGTSVRPVVESHYDSEYAPPGPRLRDYVKALRAIQLGWAGGDMRYEGRYHRVVPVPGFAAVPGQAVRAPVTPVHLAALNRYNLRTAGALCDGLVVHRFCTPDYLRDVMWGHVADGAADAGRSLDGFETVLNVFVATGEDEGAVARQREWIRAQVASYGSVPAYHPVFRHHGLGDVGDRLVAAARADLPLAERAAAVPDDVLDLFCVSATHAGLPAALVERCAGVADRVRLDLPVGPVLADVVAALADVPGTGRVGEPRP